MPKDLLTMKPEQLAALEDKEASATLRSLKGMTPEKRLEWYDANVVDLVSLIAHVRRLTRLVMSHEARLDD